MGAISEMATAAPGYNSLRPNTCAPLAETLRLNGYSTAPIGKCHEVPVFESSPIGPFDHWPNPGNGFEHFYGFIGDENNQYYPALYEQTTPVEPWGTPEEGYHLMDGFGKGGDVALHVDGDKVATGRVERTHKQIFSMDETTEVGSDAGSTVSEDYGPRGNAFSGKVH